MSARGAVAAGNADTVAAAVDVLRAGGTAVDAALAAGFAATVSEPGLASLGGGGFLLARSPGGGPVLLDFFVDAPGRGRDAAVLTPHFTPVAVDFLGVEQVFHAGWGSVGVPGCLDGFVRAHERLGTLPLADVVAPAQRLAARGAVLDEVQAEILELIRGIVLLGDEGRQLFAPSGQLLGGGGVLHNEQLAAFLADVAAGRVRRFADAPLAGRLHEAMDAGGGAVTAADLEAYRVRDRPPLHVVYRDAQVITNPPPSFGGSLVAAALEGLDADPAAPGLATVAAALVTMSAQHPSRPTAVRGTTHISVADADGGVASMTVSNGSCSGMFVPGTGVQLNNMMGEADLHPEGFHATPPGTRIGSMMAPTIVDAPDGTTYVLGSGGSERIRSALLRVITSLVGDGGGDPTAAVLAPRLHWDRRTLQVEPGLGAALAPLTARWPVREWAARHLYFGGVHVVTRRPDGSMQAAGDPRRGGASAVV